MTAGRHNLPRRALLGAAFGAPALLAGSAGLEADARGLARGD